MSEQQFIGNTAPTLAGIKTGSLFPYHYSSKQEAVKALRSYNRRLTPKGLRLMPLRCCARQATRIAAKQPACGSCAAACPPARRFRMRSACF